MRVDDRTIGGSSLQRLTGAEQTPRTGAGSRYGDARYSAGIDQIEISDTASLVQKVVSRGSAERAERLQKLTDLLQAGRYTVPAIQVGRALVNLTLAARESE